MDMNKWKKQDVEFAPKRKVNNKLSWKNPHSTGYFYSNKMERSFEYESMGECLFYFFLELDPLTLRYYVQPCEIGIPYYDKEGDRQHWIHIPDVLVFRKHDPPCLFEIKSQKQYSKRLQLIDKWSNVYAQKQGWSYTVIFPKTLPKEIIHNINFLIGFIRRRNIYTKWGPEVLEKLSYLQPCSIEVIARSFTTKVDPLFILPVIYHLIATGYVHIDVNEKVSPHSIIKLNEKEDTLFGNYLISEVFNDET
ncbi:TnsA endonuclease N-terminal domain-containing protein [Peribacillus glennii]|uniref:TnsA endonuclease N-terminal domain-containing protein n=1 Tax=Peribacillus glennii TaxID=2303991 RepID=A0A372L6L6_9BACI|nr:TnsA endonuclease N-terminal domain-containing protein [Peribacillus glennii]RFU60739.1 hypothetical protein D0466_20515 [Peribacillus glennii]